MVSPVKILHLQTIKREYLPAERLNRFLLQSPDAGRRIGSLPYDWIKYSKRENIPDITRQVGELFERFSKEIDNIRSKNEDRLIIAQQGLINALQKILGRNDIRISYAGEGALKHCQRIEVGDYSYAFSTFKSKETSRKQFADYFHEGHGKGNEPQAAFVVYKRNSHGRMARPFMANLSRVDDRGGYILSKFIDEKHPAKRRFGRIEMQRKYILNTDPNYISGIFIEAGGCIPNKKYIQNPEIRDIWLRFARIIDSNVDFLKHSEKNVKVYQTLSALAEAGRDICNLDLNTLSPDERRTAFRIVKTLRKVREYKEKLISEGKFEGIRVLLNEDMIEAFPYDVYGKEFGGYASLWYPGLFAHELGISNVPDLETMLSLSAKYSDDIKINFAKYYSKSEVLEWLKYHYVPERDMKLMENLKELYDI